MSIQAYWNTYLGPIGQENGEWEFPAGEIAEQVGELSRIEQYISQFPGVDYKLRNLGENLELEVSGNAIRVMSFLKNYDRSVRPPFLIYTDSEIEREMVKDETVRVYGENIDVELRKDNGWMQR